MTTRTEDALDLLDADHQAVHKLFQAYRALAANDAPEARRKALAEQICMELVIHAKLEEELFYPPVREAIRDDDLMDEAEVEHASAKDLIVQILSMDPHEELYDAKVTVLGEYIDHHVREEREEMFPKARRCGIDLLRLGERLRERKRELQAVPEALREELLVSLMA
ncbi:MULTISPECIES: hemerythrin domain-containing protein [Ramlibacter]|uniref:Hemerythrin domain-containing protein n=1 Tax=Ramlibacter pinisoli TaxID=2682844 RepID=A0A6N8IT14_9BURK|nr:MULTISPECIES: hemerythrin domain-containing protein [Ramlibacter]MBA2964047.1 hemerythrin domain-containing protein [Ramlibacter sp. CGMCC 1.13660]MVQ29013.1 hemerythrin domain-containing protein [Ramlibacter pinisoli]